MAEETIFALASGAGRTAISVFRISGPASGPVLAGLAGALPPARRASLRTLRDPSGAMIDQGIVLWMPGPASYTGEDSAELHVHGGTAVQEDIAEALMSQGVRPAEPGEFTRRALLNGRLDVLEAEAVGDLVAAETRAQREQALRVLRGELGVVYRDWTERLRRVMARQEALIDFPDEDLPPEVEEAIADETAAIADEIGEHLADGRRGERVREGLVFAIAGPPNVGKSSLINVLAGRDVAITGPIPGTTRDAIEARIVLAGVPVTLVDTAGLRDSEDPVEAEGVRRARKRAGEADLLMLVSAPGLEAIEPTGTCAELLRLFNKADLGTGCARADVFVSALTGGGIAALKERLEAAAARMTFRSGPPPLTRARHRAALGEARDRLEAAGTAPLPELRAEDLRLALRALGRVTGAVDVESVLDALFSEFCIGK